MLKFPCFDWNFDLLIEICWYYDDEIKDLILCVMYDEYKVLFDWKTRQIQGMYCPFVHIDYATRSLINKDRSFWDKMLLKVSNSQKFQKEILWH